MRIEMTCRCGSSTDIHASQLWEYRRAEQMAALWREAHEKCLVAPPPSTPERTP